MRLIWTKSKRPLSVIIRFITKDDCSHFAFVFESAAKGLMFESNLLGTHPSFYQSSLKTHTIVHELDIPLTVETEDKIWDIVIQKYDGKKYAFKAALYLGWRKLLFRILRTPIPLKNKWADESEYFCDQVYDVLNNIPGFISVDVMSGMDTPHDVWEKVNGRV